MDGLHFTFVGYKSGQVETDKTEEGKRKKEAGRTKLEFKLRKTSGGQCPNQKPKVGKNLLSHSKAVLKDPSSQMWSVPVPSAMERSAFTWGKAGLEAHEP